MWKFILFLAFLLPLASIAQVLPTNAENRRFSLTETVEASGVSAKVLHDKTLAWMAKFKAPQSEIQQNKEDVIVLKGFKKINVKTDDVNTAFPLHFSLTVQFSDGSYTYKVTDFSPDGINYYTPQTLKHPDEQKYKNKKDKAAYTTVYEGYNNGMLSIGKELKAALKRPLPVTKK